MTTQDRTTTMETLTIVTLKIKEVNTWKIEDHQEITVIEDQDHNNHKNSARMVIMVTELTERELIVKIDQND